MPALRAGDSGAQGARETEVGKVNGELRLDAEGSGSGHEEGLRLDRMSGEEDRVIDAVARRSKATSERLAQREPLLLALHAEVNRWRMKAHTERLALVREFGVPIPLGVGKALDMLEAAADDLEALVRRWEA